MKPNNRNKKKVIVVGKGILAIRIADWFKKSKDYKLLFVVPVIPEPSWTASFVKWAKKNNVSFVKSGHYKDIPNVKKPGWKIDLVFSVFYDKIIENWFIRKCQKILNIHNGPLPKYRGVSPINWALKNKEKEHGVTIHKIIAKVDAGPIVTQLRYSIHPEFDEVKDVYNRALKYGFLLFKQTMPILDKIKPYNQDDSLATYYSKEQKEDLGERRDFTREKPKGN